MHGGNGFETSAAGPRFLFFPVHVAPHPFEEMNRLTPMMMSGTKDSKLDMIHSFFPGRHLTGMEETRNLRNVVRSFLAIAARGPALERAARRRF